MDQVTDAQPRQALQYDGRLGELYRIFLVNLLLTIITLGIYRFWAITRWRRYFWSRMRFQGERLEYTGRGIELFLGFLMAIGILIGLVIAAVLLAAGLAMIYPPLLVVPLVALYVIIFILAFAARFSAQRYRLSRTLWCGIRGGMQGSALAYGARAALYVVLMLLTLFQLLPWMQIRLAERRISASRLGSAAFSFRGRARSVYPAFLATLVGIIVVYGVVAGLVWSAIGPQLLPVLRTSVGGDDPRLAAALQHAIPFVIVGAVVAGIGAALIGCWYTALFLRHIAGNTRLETLAFSSTMTGPRLLWLVLSNSLIVLFTLGLGLPIAIHRVARLLIGSFQVAGTLDVEALHQSTLAMPRTGEGMLQVLDHGAIF
jgi:uncharacterized membrane protein YjgN (DUF898 family)